MARVAFARDVSFDELRANGWVKLPLADAPLADGRFPTPSGKCIIDSPVFGVADHLPNYESASSTPELAERYPLAMISPPARNFLNSSFVNVKSLRDIEGEPLVEIHASDAALRGIVDGQMVRVFNDRGEYRCKAQLSSRARPGVDPAEGRHVEPRGRVSPVREAAREQAVHRARLVPEGIVPRRPRHLDRLVEGRRQAPDVEL